MEQLVPRVLVVGDLKWQISSLFSSDGRRWVPRTNLIRGSWRIIKRWIRICDSPRKRLDSIMTSKKKRQIQTVSPAIWRMNSWKWLRRLLTSFLKLTEWEKCHFNAEKNPECGGYNPEEVQYRYGYTRTFIMDKYDGEKICLNAMDKFCEMMGKMLKAYQNQKCPLD
jgi:hypothetical protein